MLCTFVWFYCNKMRAVHRFRIAFGFARFFSIVFGVQCVFFIHYRALKTMHSFPKIIHQIHKNETSIDARNRPLMEQCRAINSDFKYKFWSDDSADALVKRRMSKQVYDKWVALEPPMKRVDSFRYILMFIYGGVYLDNDFECSQRHPLRHWIPRIPYGAGATGVRYACPFRDVSSWHVV